MSPCIHQHAQFTYKRPKLRRAAVAAQFALVVVLLALPACSASASLIAGQVSVDVGIPRTLLSDPIAVSVSGPANAPAGPNYKASANFMTGKYRAFTFIDSEDINGIGGFPFARAQATQFTYLNDTATPWVFNPGDFKLDVKSDYLALAGFKGRFSQRTNVLFSLTHPGGSAHAQFFHIYAGELQAGTGAFIELLNDIQAEQSIGGASTGIQGFSSQGVTANVTMPGFTVDPGETFSFDIFLEVISTTDGFPVGAGLTVITDAFQTAQLSLTLAPGVSADGFAIENLGIPSWIHTTPIPEPSSALCFAVSLLVFSVRRPFNRR